MPSEVSIDEIELKNRIEAMLAPLEGAGEEAVRILEAARAMKAEGYREVALDWAGKRAAGVPLGLLTGRQRFLGVEMLAQRDVLVAREETELLGGEALAWLKGLAERDPARELRMIDMGCGSGNLGCALGLAMPRARIWASDITPSCVELTRRNIVLHGLEDRVQATQGDLFAPLSAIGLEGTMDLVVMNPPYIPSPSLAKARAGLLDHEPREAFDGGPYGISILTRLLNEAPGFLKAGGSLMFEFGLGQDRIVQALAARKGAYEGLRFARDAQGEARVAVLRKVAAP